MLSAIGVFFAKQSLGLLLGFVSDFLVGLFKTWQANEAQRERGRNEVIAKENEQAAETTDAMANVPRASDDDVAGRLSGGKF